MLTAPTSKQKGCHCIQTQGVEVRVSGRRRSADCGRRRLLTMAMTTHAESLCSDIIFLDVRRKSSWQMTREMLYILGVVQLHLILSIVLQPYHPFSIPTLHRSTPT